MDPGEKVLYFAGNICRTENEARMLSLGFIFSEMIEDKNCQECQGRRVIRLTRLFVM